MCVTIGMSMDRLRATLVTLQGNAGGPDYLMDVKGVIASAWSGHRRLQGCCSSVMDACWCGQLLPAGMEPTACKPASGLAPLALHSRSTAAAVRPAGTQRT